MTCKLPPYILQELPNITEIINYPIRNVQRIKFTCFALSKSLIAFGATSGGIYVYNRDPCEFVQLIPSKDGPITRLVISTDEKHIGFANGKGSIMVTECDQALRSGYSLITSKEHHGNEITSMVWSGNMLFCGDDVGRVSVLQLQSFIAKTMFQSSSQIILSLDSRICQLDAKDCMLLVSTLTRCYICNIIQEQYRQIGQKLRDGEFGACFVTEDKCEVNGAIEHSQHDCTELKKYNIVDDGAGFIVKRYCVSIGALDESKFVPNNIFLTYLSASPDNGDLLDAVVNDPALYEYFVDSCISTNARTRKLSTGCECGFPLPHRNETPAFSGLIDQFVERQWSRHTREQCYAVCKRMPYSWRKILHLRRSEDLLSVLRILLQMLDEALLHSFLPQFTMDTWDRAVQLYAVLHANMCLNCGRRFDHVSVRDTLSWDDLGSLIVKSVGGKRAVEVMRRHAKLIDTGALTLKFYHTCLLVSMYERYDVTIVAQLVDAVYSSYDFEESRSEICQLLRCARNGQIKNTALPLSVAATSAHWGLKPVRDKLLVLRRSKGSTEHLTLNGILTIVCESIKGGGDCTLCGLPLRNEVLIKDGGIWTYRCGHTFHGACLDLNGIKLCPSCLIK
ncbi:unnamed protein product, partial [Iphiclides podalirius]